MGLPTLLLLAIVAVAAAYALGRLLRWMSEASAASSNPLRRLIRPAVEREADALVSWLLSQAFEQTGVRVADDRLAYSRIVEAATKAMQELQTKDTASISLPFLTADTSGPRHFETQVSRKLVEDLVRD